MIITNNITPLERTDLARYGNVNGTSDATLNLKEKNIFDDVFKAALTVFNDTNNFQKIADKTQVDFASGKHDDMLAVLMAEQKATASLELTVLVTGKVIEAYREIMRIQL